MTSLRKKLNQECDTTTDLKTMLSIFFLQIKLYDNYRAFTRLTQFAFYVELTKPQNNGLRFLLIEFAFDANVLRDSHSWLAK